MVYNGYAKLPPDLFHVNIPLIATYTEEEIELFGIPLQTKNGEVVHNSYHDMTNVYINLDRIIDLYMEGYPITLIKREDTVKMYNLLDTYLIGTDPERYSLNARSGTDDRVVFINKFIEEFLGYNKHTIVKGNLTAASGFDLGVDKMNMNGYVGNSEPQIVTGKLGITAGYQDHPTYVPPTTGTTYVVNHQPVIDMSKVKRNIPGSYKKGVTIE